MPSISNSSDRSELIRVLKLLKTLSGERLRNLKIIDKNEELGSWSDGMSILYVLLLESGKLYAGETRDIRVRLRDHNKNQDEPYYAALLWFVPGGEGEAKRIAAAITEKLREDAQPPRHCLLAKGGSVA